MIQVETCRFTRDSLSSLCTGLKNQRLAFLAAFLFVEIKMILRESHKTCEENVQVKFLKKNRNSFGR